MKKYIQPNSIIINVQSEVILAGSTIGFNSDPITNPSTIGAKKRYYDGYESWEDYEEEE